MTENSSSVFFVNVMYQQKQKYKDVKNDLLETKIINLYLADNCNVGCRVYFNPANEFPIKSLITLFISTS